MPSRRALGILALCAVILAAISFAAVDVTIAHADRCAIAGSCTDSGVPITVVVYAVIGTVALLGSVLPAINWLAQVIHHPQHDDDPARYAVLRPAYDEDDL